MDSGEITELPIDPASVFQSVQDVRCGGIASFIGCVRAENQGRKVKTIFYECHPRMAKRELRSLIQRIKNETGVNQLNAVHRVGELNPGAVAVVVVAASPHRNPAFRACGLLIEGIKTTLPIWKKESYQDGSGGWINPSLSLQQKMIRGIPHSRIRAKESAR